MRDFPFENPMNRGAKIAGWIYLPIHVVLLPVFLGSILLLVSGKMPSEVACNIWYYAIGLVFTLFAMWKFLRRSYENMLDRLTYSLAMILVAYAVDAVLSLVLQLGMSLFGELPLPNNDAVLNLAGQDYRRMIAVAVIMAPIVEECLFRGVIFGSIRQKSRFWAYLVSVLLFSLYHVWQYALVYAEPRYLLSALQYVPVSVALAYCYDRTQSIWPPVFFHMFINALSLSILAG